MSKYIDIDKLKKNTKDKTLFRVMFTWDENNNFYVKEKNGSITTILDSFTPKVNSIVIGKIKLAEKTQFNKPGVTNFRYFIDMDGDNNIPISIFKIEPYSSNRESYFDELKTYTKKYNNLTLKKMLKKKKGGSSKGKTLKTNKNVSENYSTDNSAESAIVSFQKDITVIFFEFLLMIKLFHWKTHSYATHKATDELYSSFNEHMDKFIEVLLGKTGSRIDLKNVTKISLTDLNNQEQLVQKVNGFKNYLVNLTTSKALSSASNTDLLNIRDEILGDMNQFLYLLTFK